MRRFFTATQLTYTQLRSVQISIVFTVTVFVEFLWRYPNAAITGYILMLVYAGFDNGTTLKRAYHRFLGSSFGIILGSFLWIIGNLDHRLMILIFPIILYFVYFFADHEYHLTTIFTVCGALAASGYYAAFYGYDVRHLMNDYAMCSMIAFVILIIFEYIFFRRYNHMRRFVIESQTNTIIHLFQLIKFLNQKVHSHKIWFNECAHLIENLNQTRRLLQNTHFVLGAREEFGNEFQLFFHQVNRIYGQIKGLYYASHYQKQSPEELQLQLEQINLDLQRLKTQFSDTLLTIPGYERIYVAMH